MFTLTFTTGNAAFDDNTSAECARILRRVADDLDRRVPVWFGDESIFDANGNSIGTWNLTTEDNEK